MFLLVGVVLGRFFRADSFLSREPYDLLFHDSEGHLCFEMHVHF